MRSRSKSWGLFANLTFQDQPSAGIGVVDVQKLWVFFDSEYARATLCEDRAYRSALAVAPCEFVACEVVFGSCRVVCTAALGRGVDPRLVRGSFSRQKSQLLSANVVRGCSSAPAALAQSNLHRAPPLAQSNLRAANCTEHLHVAASAGQLGQTKSQVFRWENYYHESHCTESS